VVEGLPRQVLLVAALADLRAPYGPDARLDETDLAADPLSQFLAWFADAHAAGIVEPNAMTLATAGPDGDVSARTVLLKDVGPRGFVLYSNGASRKGRDLADNPRACLVFPWLVLHRQVVVLGEVEPVTRGEVQAYFDSRPHESRIGAAASEQSTVIASRAVLDARVAALTARYPPGIPVPVPATWCGYVVHAVSVEFWQGRPARLHDRLRYLLQADGTWLRQRLAP